MVTVLSVGRAQGSGQRVASRGPTVVGLECGHMLNGWSKAGGFSNLCSVGRRSEKALKYRCCCPSETRDPAAPKAEQHSWKPCHRNHITALGARKPNAIVPSALQTVGIQAKRSRVSPRNNQGGWGNIPMNNLSTVNLSNSRWWFISTVNL